MVGDTEVVDLVVSKLAEICLYILLSATLSSSPVLIHTVLSDAMKYKILHERNGYQLPHHTTHPNLPSFVYLRVTSLPNLPPTLTPQLPLTSTASYSFVTISCPNPPLYPKSTSYKIMQHYFANNRNPKHQRLVVSPVDGIEFRVNFLDKCIGWFLLMASYCVLEDSVRIIGGTETIKPWSLTFIPFEVNRIVYCWWFSVLLLKIHNYCKSFSIDSTNLYSRRLIYGMMY